MLHHSIILLFFLSSLLTLFGLSRGKKTSNSFEADGTSGNLGEVERIHNVSEKTGFATFRANGNMDETGQALEGCFGGVGRWLNLSSDKKKSPTQKEVRYWKCCRKSKSPDTKSGHLAEKDKCCVYVTGAGCDGRTIMSSVKETRKMIGGSAGDLKVSSPRSSNSPNDALKAFDSRSQGNSGKVQKHGGKIIKTYRSKKVANRHQKHSIMDPPGCGCEKCVGRACLVCCEVMKPACFCLAVPCLCLSCCCERSFRPLDEYCTELYP